MLINKKIIYNHKARQALETGMSVLAQAVGITLGPKGKSVILESKIGAPHIVNHGMIVAKEIEFKNPIENMGVLLMRQAALKTNDVVGDGSTTAMVLAQAIVEEGIRSIATGGNPLLIKKGIDKAVKFIVNKISEYSQPVMRIEDIVNIASTSAGNNIIVGNSIANAIRKVGPEGLISLEQGQSTITSLEVIDGISFEKGYMSSYFLSNPLQTEVLQENPLILLVDRKIELVQQELICLLEEVALMSRPLLIIAEDIEKDALSTLVLNKVKGIIDVVAVRIPGFGDRKQAWLEDIAVLTNATIISEQFGLTLDKVSLDFLGSAQRIIVSKNMTTIISCANQSALQLRCAHLRKQIELSDNSYEKENLQERLAKLSGGIAIIRVAAATTVEMLDKKLCFEDAIKATRAALEEGIVPGGGSILVYLSYDLELWAGRYLSSDELLGAYIIARALLVPLYTIVQNTGCNGPIVVERLRSMKIGMGYDADKCQIVDMYSVGIIDPAKVIRLSLQNASSIASIILATDCVISNPSV